MSLIILLLIVLIKNIYSTPIDNNIVGTPIIECGSNALRFRINSKNPFNGRIFVRGYSNVDGCHIEGHGLHNEAGIEISFDSKCRINRERSANPKGLYITSTVIVSFHPIFITKVDTAYTIRCIYYEVDKVVNANIDVAELPANLKTQSIPMPICKYELLDGGPYGTPLAYATVGSSVYHKWTCESKTENAFCMLVHSCTVEDGYGQVVNILDNEGCAIDRFLLNNLEYSSDLTAGQETHVYKYADRDTLFFQCQIAITVKESGSLCYRPECRDPKRSSSHPPIFLKEHLNIRPKRQQHLASESRIDIILNNSSSTITNESNFIKDFEVVDVTTHLKAIEDFTGEFSSQNVKYKDKIEICLTQFWMILTCLLIVAYTIFTVIFVGFCIFKCKRRRSYQVN